MHYRLYEPDELQAPFGHFPRRPGFWLRAARSPLFWVLGALLLWIGAITAIIAVFP